MKIIISTSGELGRMKEFFNHFFPKDDLKYFEFVAAVADSDDRELIKANTFDFKKKLEVNPKKHGRRAPFVFRSALRRYTSMCQEPAVVLIKGKNSDSMKESFLKEMALGIPGGKFMTIDMSSVFMERLVYSAFAASRFVKSTILQKNEFGSIVKKEDPFPFTKNLKFNGFYELGK